MIKGNVKWWEVKGDYGCRPKLQISGVTHAKFVTSNVQARLTAEKYKAITSLCDCYLRSDKTSVIE